jgi:hypothetical protein
MKKLTVGIVAAGLAALSLTAPAAAFATEGQHRGFVCVEPGTRVDLTWNVEQWQEVTPAVPGIPESYAAVGNYADTRATGHYEAGPDGLHIWTEGATSTDKVAGYLATSIPLSAVAESGATLNYTTVTGITPGSQLVVDIDGDDVGDGILVGEAVYGDNWWLSNSSTDAFKALDPSGAEDGGNGSAYFGTLAEWSAAAPDATVVAVGFSLGSGVLGEGYVTGFVTAGTTYHFTSYTPAVAEVPAVFDWVVVGSGQGAALPADVEGTRYVQTGTVDVPIWTEISCDRDAVVETSDWTVVDAGSCDEQSTVEERTVTTTPWVKHKVEHKKFELVAGEPKVTTESRTTAWTAEQVAEECPVATPVTTPTATATPAAVPVTLAATGSDELVTTWGWIIAGLSVALGAVLIWMNALRRRAERETAQRDDV